MYENTREGSRMIYSICFKAKVKWLEHAKAQIQLQNVFDPLVLLYPGCGPSCCYGYGQGQDFKRLLEIVRLSNLLIRFLILAPRQKGSLDQVVLD